MSFGPLRWLVASPEFHHRHHVDDAELYHNNFAGQLPLVDWLFGTLHMPKGVWPERYGVAGEMPSGYLAPRGEPFRPTTTRSARSVRYASSLVGILPMPTALCC